MSMRKSQTRDDKRSGFGFNPLRMAGRALTYGCAIDGVHGRARGRAGICTCPTLSASCNGDLRPHPCTRARVRAGIYTCPTLSASCGGDLRRCPGRAELSCGRCGAAELGVHGAVALVGALE